MSANRFTEIFYMYFESIQTSLIFSGFHMCVYLEYTRKLETNKTHSFFFRGNCQSKRSLQPVIGRVPDPSPSGSVYPRQLFVRACVRAHVRRSIYSVWRKTRAGRNISTWNKNIPFGKNWVWNVFWWGTWMSANPAWQPGYAQGRSKRTTRPPCLTIMQVDCLCDS